MMDDNNPSEQTGRGGKGEAGAINLLSGYIHNTALKPVLEKSKRDSCMGQATASGATL